MENKSKMGLRSKRMFGKDLTNLERKTKVHSFLQKAPQMADFRLKSRSLYKKRYQSTRDPLSDHEADILSFMLSIQQKQEYQIMVGINGDMRQILINWLIDVHSHFGLKEQTLYLNLIYLNKFTSMVQITKQEYQLAGVACLWIACKVEEIHPPIISNFIQVTDNCYTDAQLKAMEGRILLALQFNLSYTTPLNILETISEKQQKEFSGKLSNESHKTLATAKYIIQLSLLYGLGKQYCMNTLVVSSLMLSDIIYQVKSDTKMLDNATVQKESLECFLEMCVALENYSQPNHKLSALKRKFACEKYWGVSRVVRIQCK